MFKVLAIALFMALSSSPTNAAETCSRVAIINYQEVLVDTNSTEKGEGLRFHLEKDPQAKAYLETYQRGTEIKWQNAAVGTLGTGLLLTGLFTNGDRAKKTLFISGAAIMIVNFLIGRTLESTNESNLNRAIEEYNKRNLPKIYFNSNNPINELPSTSMNFSFEKTWRF